MRRLPTLGVAAVALAAIAASVVQAQPNPGNGPVNCYQPLMPAGVTDVPRPGLRNRQPMDAATQRQAAAGLAVAVPQMRLACAADRQTLCADKMTTPSSDRCLRYNRLKLSASCKRAWDNVTLASQGRL